MPFLLSLTPREELLWLAAVLDGEGCFTFNGQYPNIVLSMTDEDTVRRAHQITAVGEVCGPYQPKNQKHKRFWRWKVANREHVFALCRLILPYMSARRTSAIEAILSKQKIKPEPLWVRVAEFER
jgi:hypothetical protein